MADRDVDAWIGILGAVLLPEAVGEVPRLLTPDDLRCIKIRACTFCHAMQASKTAYAAAKQVVINGTPWQAARPSALSPMLDILFAVVRERWMHRGEISSREAAHGVVPFAVLANCVLAPFRAPTLHILEPAAVARPRFKHERDSVVTDFWELLLRCPGLLDAVHRQRDRNYMRYYGYTRAQHHEQFLGYAPGEIVRLTSVGEELQAEKLGGEWIEGGPYFRAAVQYTLEPGATGVILRSDENHHWVATRLPTAEQLELQAVLFADPSAWEELTAAGEMAHCMWFYPTQIDSFTRCEYGDGTDSDDEESFQSDLWLQLADAKELNLHVHNATAPAHMMEQRERRIRRTHGRLNPHNLLIHSLRRLAWTKVMLAHTGLVQECNMPAELVELVAAAYTESIHPRGAGDRHPLREAIDISARHMPDEAGGEAVKSYVAEGGRFRHVFQGYFQSSRAIETSKLNSHSWTLNFVDAVVKHLESPASWSEFVAQSAEDLSFELHMHHKLDSGAGSEDWNDWSSPRLRPVLFVLGCRLQGWFS